MARPSEMATCSRLGCKRKTAFAVNGKPLCSAHRKGSRVKALQPLARYVVAACEACPFVAHGFAWCAHPDGERRELKAERAEARPEWCPLSVGPILIEAGAVG